MTLNKYLNSLYLSSTLDKKLNPSSAFTLYLGYCEAIRRRGKTS